MKKLFLTSLLMLIAIFGIAQTTSFPITLTEADGLPGSFVVQNYLYQSKVFNVDKPVQKIRLTVCNTNTANDAGRGSHDGVSAYNGTGQPFFTMSEVRFFDENGDAVAFVATGNSVDPGDGGGFAALSDKDETTYLHTNYGGRCESMPTEYHYVEFELEKEVTTFSFTIQTRSRYYKNLITYMGVTGGDIDATEEEMQYLPFPEQNFQLGEKVTDVADLATPGAFFVMQGTAEDYSYDYEYSISGEPYVVTHTMPGDLYMRSPYEGCTTPSAANVFYLIPDADGVEDTYRVRWLNSGRYIAGHTGGNDIWATWTRDINEAAALTFARNNGNFEITLPATNNNGDKFTAYLGYDGYGRMDYVGDIDNALNETARPHSYNWAIFNATINGAAIANRLQAAIDEAEARIEAAGGRNEEYDEGEYDYLIANIDAAKALIDYPDVAASEILAATNELNQATIAYATVSLWSFADSIFKIEEMVDEGLIEFCEAPDWKVGAYLISGFESLIVYLDGLDRTISSCESLADVDAAIAALYAQIDAFWATQITKDANIVELPYRIGRPEEGLPGVNTNSIFRWESAPIYFTEEIDQIRMTVFKTKANRTLNGKPFVCLTELEFYDLAGNKIPMTGDSYYSPSVANEGGGLAGLCDGSTTTGTHFHSQWGADDDYDGSEYFYLDITFPEPVSGFKYVQYGRGNGYDDVPTDFLFGYYGETMFPEDNPFPAKEDPYGTVLGEQIESVDEITDEGFYALVGNWNAAPEGNGSSHPIFYTGLNCYGPDYEGADASCVFKITKTDNDSTFNIFSYAANCYLMNNGGPGAYYTALTYDIEKAAKVRIVPSAPTREELGAEEFPNAFFIYHYVDTIVKEVNEDGEYIKKPHPYLFLDSWGGEGSGRLVWRSMYGLDEIAEPDYNGNYKYLIGELEWHIYKMTMKKPNLYWLQAIYDQASATEMLVGTDPGYYTEASVGAFANALVQAQAALESDDDAVAAAAVQALQSTIHLPETAERNPVTAGVYVIESDDARFVANLGSPVALAAYFNPFEKYNGELSASSEYSLWWTKVAADYSDADAIDDMFKFQLIPAVITEDAPEGTIYSEMLAIWFEDSVVTEEQLANAYFIKSLKTNQYIGVSELTDEMGAPRTSNNIGFTDEPEYPYIIREQGAYRFDIWCPVGPNNCLHMENHGNGAGQPSHIVHWNGGSGVQASLWQLRTISTEIDTNIYNLSISGENGTYSGAGEYMAGTTVELTAVPDTGYVFSGWYKDGKLLNSNPTYYYTVRADVSLVAKFVKAQYKVSYTGGANGTVKLSATTVSYGDSVSIELTPAKNYSISSLTVNGTDVTADIINGRYTVYNATGDVKFAVSFAANASSNQMGVKALRTFPGSTLVIPVEMSNTEDITAFQFDIYLPKGISINTDEEGELMIALDAARKTSSHTLTYAQLADGGVRVVAYSSSNKPFRGSEGALVNITTTVPEDMNIGDYQLTMKDIRLANTNEEEHVTVSKTSTISVTFMRGDVNMDYIVSISDVVAAVNYILEKPTKVFNFMAADVTGDDKVSIADIVGIVNIILNPETEYSNGYNAKRAANDRSGDSTSMGEASAEAGSVAIPVSLNNTNEYTAFQMDVELPEGATLASATLGSRAASSHSITWKAIADNKVRVVAYSVKNATFAGNAGELVTLNIEAAEGATGAVAVDNVRMATAEGVEMAVSGCGSNIDINGTTGIGSIDAAMFKAYAEDGTLVVESGKEMQLSVYAANGRLVKIIDVTVGKNKFYNFAEGVYVINGVKVIVK